MFEEWDTVMPATPKSGFSQSTRPLLSGTKSQRTPWVLESTRTLQSSFSEVKEELGGAAESVAEEDGDGLCTIVRSC